MKKFLKKKQNDINELIIKINLENKFSAFFFKVFNMFSNYFYAIIIFSLLCLFSLGLVLLFPTHYAYIIIIAIAIPIIMLMIGDYIAIKSIKTWGMLKELYRLKNAISNYDFKYDVLDKKLDKETKVKKKKYIQAKMKYILSTVNKYVLNCKSISERKLEIVKKGNDDLLIKNWKLTLLKFTTSSELIDIILQSISLKEKENIIQESALEKSQQDLEYEIIKSKLTELNIKCERLCHTNNEGEFDFTPTSVGIKEIEKGNENAMYRSAGKKIYEQYGTFKHKNKDK